ncbi:ADP-ribosyltransferase [Nocardia sp. BMG111209]|uniref:ADP-ribosyltransferase n=1 Tax=Nocardia sp. BMG111209 TaxID=1160137 RepID=UPI0009DBDE24|nr:ADP-ribosyltransferase [Nocardia sp. BMG111209]
MTREIDGNVYGITGEAGARAMVGKDIVEPGFLSTSMSVDPPRNPSRGNPAILDLVVPAGTQALAVGELAEFPAERELLVIDARRLRILGVSFDQARRVWRLRGYVVD